MPREVRFKPSGLRDFQDLPGPMRAKVGKRLDALCVDPRPPGVKELEGGEGLLRLRVGDWRIVCSVDDGARVVMVVKVGHRGDVYRRR
ncbi:MAG: type II toxin-antitoxin system RelE/ParE family toxin [Planctomycetes bacterium]|nr:type II toxin-antitoxin system RelE/ParE family toxin [Planctomycetota bacterium]